MEQQTNKTRSHTFRRLQWDPGCQDHNLKPKKCHFDDDVKACLNGSVRCYVFFKRISFELMKSEYFGNEMEADSAPKAREIFRTI